MEKLAKIFIGEPTSGEPKFENLDKNHKVLIGKELTKKLTQKELSDIIKNTREDYFIGNIVENSIGTIIGVGMAVAGSCFEYKLLDDFMLFGGVCYGAFEFTGTLHNLAKYYVTRKLYKNKNN